MTTGLIGCICWISCRSSGVQLYYVKSQNDDIAQDLYDTTDDSNSPYILGFYRVNLIIG